MKRSVLAATVAAGALVAATLPSAAAVDARCSVDWSKVDSNSDGKVGRQEVKQSLDASFKTLDMDGNGTVTRSEYRDCHLTATGFISEPAKGSSQQPANITKPDPDSTLTDEELENRIDWFNAADANRDKRVTSDEAAAYGEKQYEQSGDTRSKAQVAAQNGAFFSTLDRDADKEVTENEAKSKMRSSQTDKMAADTNEDGAISKDEWLAHSDRSMKRAMEQSAKAEDAGSPKAQPSSAEQGPTVWFFFAELI